MSIREDRVVVVTGLGGMGLAIARRSGTGSVVVLADVDPEVVSGAAGNLRQNGYRVVEQTTDVSNRASVEALASAAADAGRVEVVVHTAGVSPVHSPVEAILRVDLLGPALMLDAFGSVIASGGVGVFISSMAGTMSGLSPDLERRLATTPTDDLLALPELAAENLTDPGSAYMLAKRANQVRVRAASLVWGKVGARVNSISPGIVSTPMGAAEMEGPHGQFMRSMLEGSPAGRAGTPDDIAAAVEFLVGPGSRYITGTDLLVDGGVVASVLSPDLEVDVRES